MEPSINGFTLKGLKTMMGRDGYMINCTLLFNGKKCGDYINQGDGSEYIFYPAEGFSQMGIENALRRFPMIDTHDEELNLPPIHWNIGILVDRLIGQKETLKEPRKAQKKAMSLPSSRTTGRTATTQFLFLQQSRMKRLQRSSMTV